MKNTVKLIALDLDDTLLRRDTSISDYTVSVLEAAMQKGIQVVLASGRNRCGMIDSAERIGLNKRQSYLICNNGSQTVESDTEKELAGHYIEPELALTIFDKVEALELSCHLYVEDILYAAKETVFSKSDSHLTKLKPVIPDDFRHILKTVPVYKMLIPAEPQIIAAAEPEFRAVFGKQVTMFISKPYFLECIPPHTGKGEALLELAARLSIPRESILAFGDSMNDETMIRLAGYGVAMKNGLPAIQACADAVTDYTNDEDGVARFLEQYVMPRLV